MDGEIIMKAMCLYDSLDSDSNLKVFNEDIDNLRKQIRKTTNMMQGSMGEDDIIVFDTNVLLNFYFIEDLYHLSIYIELINEKVWIPNQVYEEFLLHRKDRMREILQIVNGILQFENTFTNDVQKKLLEYDKLPSEYGKRIRQKIYNRLSGSEKYVEHLKEKLLELNKRMKVYMQEDKDIYFEMIKQKVFINVGKKYEQSKKDSILEEVKNKKIYAGYLDSKKKENKYGDYIILRQCMDKSIQDNKNILYVTNDTKEIKDNPDYERTIMDEFKEKTHHDIQIISIDELVQKTTKQCQCLEECLEELHGYTGSDLQQYNPWNKVYDYFECLEEIVKDRREEIKFSYDDPIAYGELMYLRRVLEYCCKDIICGAILSPHYGLQMDILIKQDGILKYLCKINYKANGDDFCIFLDVDEKRWIGIPSSSIDTPVTSPNQYLKEIIQYIIVLLLENGEDVDKIETMKSHINDMLERDGRNEAVLEEGE